MGCRACRISSVRGFVVILVLFAIFRCVDFMAYYPKQNIPNTFCGYAACGGELLETVKLPADSDFDRSFGVATAACVNDEEVSQPTARRFRFIINGRSMSEWGSGSSGRWGMNASSFTEEVHKKIKQAFSGYVRGLG